MKKIMTVKIRETFNAFFILQLFGLFLPIARGRAYCLVSKNVEKTYGNVLFLLKTSRLIKIIIIISFLNISIRKYRFDGRVS